MNTYKEPALSTTLKGKTVARVCIGEWITPEDDTPTRTEADTHEIYIVFTDGSQLVCWNSEWGGVNLISPKLPDDWWPPST